MSIKTTPHALQHVSLARPRGAESDAAARRFYGELLGLEEVAPPSSLAHLSLIWYRIGASELHLFVSDREPGDVGQHYCLQLDDLDGLRARLVGAGVEIMDDIAIKNRPRFFCHDPFGNRIECTTILGSYDA